VKGSPIKIPVGTLLLANAQIANTEVALNELLGLISFMKVQKMRGTRLLPN
jgi:hypothetical protein